MSSDLNGIVRDIRKQCRLAMNGVVSSSMRNKGITYKINFGVSLSKIKEISKRYSQNEDLAKMLWREDVRELKILATLLYPLDTLTPEAALRLIEDVSTQEVREQLCANLLQHLPFSRLLLEDISKSENKAIRNTGYCLIIKTVLKDKTVKEWDEQALENIINDLSDTELKKMALLCLKTIGRFNPKNAQNILFKITRFKNSENPEEREIFDSLMFDFEFYNCL